MTRDQQKHMDSLRDQLDTPMVAADNIERKYAAEKAKHTWQETTHTPGPWQQYGQFIKKGDLHLAEVFILNRKGQVFLPQKANARLIAAAPEMLEALEWILPLAEAYLKHAPSSPDNAKLESARAAIRKAKGE